MILQPEVSIRCEVCSQEMHAELHTIYPGTCDQVIVVRPCCNREETQENLEYVKEYLIPDLHNTIDVLEDTITAVLSQLGNVRLNDSKRDIINDLENISQLLILLNKKLED